MNTTLKHLIWATVIIVFLVLMYLATKPSNDAYNKHMCAVYGYEEDCHTPLPPERRLK